MTADLWKERLNLQPHPEGGWFGEWYRSTESLAQADLPDRFAGDRSVSTAIVYLLEGQERSRFHRIQSDELWHAYDGGVLEIVSITAEGTLNVQRLGRTGEDGVLPVAMVPAGWWFAARVRDTKGYVLAGCTVSPGFDFADFELADPGELLEKYPEHADWIRQF